MVAAVRTPYQTAIRSAPPRLGVAGRDDDGQGQDGEGSVVRAAVAGADGVG